MNLQNVERICFVIIISPKIERYSWILFPKNYQIFEFSRQNPYFLTKNWIYKTSEKYQFLPSKNSKYFVKMG